MILLKKKNEIDKNKKIIERNFIEERFMMAENENSSEEEEYIDEEKKNNDTIQTEKNVYIQENKEIKIKSSQKGIEGLFKSHKEENGINRSIKRMKDMKKLIERKEAPPLPILEKYENFEPKNLKNNSSRFPVEKLMKQV